MDLVIEEHIITEVIEKDFKEHGEKVPPLKIPKDKYFLGYILFFLLGVLHILPLTFFNAANNFWMYKFRNLSDPTMSAGNRTYLQTHYASMQTIVTTIPGLLFGIWNVAFGHKFKIMNRVKLTILIEVLVFYLLTAFVKINTDDYETVFFVMVLLCSGTLMGCNSVNMVASTMLYPRFPHSYMKVCLIGEGVAGMMSSLLNVIAVAVFDDIRDSTLMYFIFGSFMVTLTLTMSALVSRSKFFTHCLDTMPEDNARAMPKKKEIFQVLYKIKLSIFMFFLLLCSIAATHTSITSLVVSEQDSTTWSKKFFTPVVTFLWTDSCALIGRFFSALPLMQRLPDMTWGIMSALRTLVLVPLVWFCNAQPRDHLPVLFPHDYQYAIIIGLVMVVNGIVMSMGMLLITRKTSKYESEIAFSLIGLIMGISSTVTSPIGMFIVDLL